MGFLASLKKSVPGSVKKPNFHAEYKLGKQLGEGGFATVYGCQSKKGPGKEVAVKVFDLKSPRVPRKDFRLEVQIMKQIGTHSSCIQFLEAFEDKRFGYLVMEKCSCNILDAFLGKKMATESELARAFHSLLQAVDHLHSVRVVHRDIKPCNILLKDDERGEKLDIKICDMGLAAVLPPEGLKRCGCIPIKAGLTEICGTTPYMPPEMLLGKHAYSELVDEWSCGVSMYVLLFGEFPYKTLRRDMELMKEVICSGHARPSFRARHDSPQPSSLACELVAALMTRDPENRTACADALTYPFFDSFLPKPTPPPSNTNANPDELLASPVDQPCASSDESHMLERLPSFHQTLLRAKSELESYEACTPLDKKRTFEEALAVLQQENGQQWRSGIRCFSEPSIRAHSELERLPARLSTHSGLSICSKGESDMKFVMQVNLPGTPSTTDDDSDC